MHRVVHLSFILVQREKWTKKHEKRKKGFNFQHRMVTGDLPRCHTPWRKLMYRFNFLDHFVYGTLIC